MFYTGIYVVKLILVLGFTKYAVQDISNWNCIRFLCLHFSLSFKPATYLTRGKNEHTISPTGNWMLYL